jgi:very-short-patch-repair endonuclease
MPERRNRPPTVKRAKRLRGETTDAEKKLWFRIRLRQIDDHFFRRQVEIGDFVVDFACLKKKLVIENSNSGDTILNPACPSTLSRSVNSAFCPLTTLP